MLTNHTNRLFEAVKESGISLNEIETRFYNHWEKPDSKTMDCFIIKIRNTAFEFWVWKKEKDKISMAYRYTKFYGYYGALEMWVDRVSGENEFIIRSKFYARIHLNTPINIDHVCWVLKKWLIYYRDNIRIPNYWEESKLSIPFTPDTSLPKDAVRPFSSTEKEQIQHAVKIFRLLLSEKFQPTDEQQKNIDDLLQYLVDAKDRLNVFDWKALAREILISIAVNLTVDTNTGKMLFQLFEQAFHTAIHLLSAD